MAYLRGNFRVSHVLFLMMRYFLKKITGKSGQGIAVEYVITFFLVAAVLSGMSLYFRRVIQGRIRDATRYAVHTVRQVYPGELYYQYEPYYAYTNAYRKDDSTETRTLIPIQPGKEIAQTEYGLNTRITTHAITLPPFGETIPPFTADP